MKQFLIRLAIYIPIISFFWSVLTPGYFTQSFPGPLAAQIVSRVTFYGITYGFWIVAYELCYRAAKALRKDKPEPVPDTRPLDHP